MQAWISIADMPTNGTALIFDASTGAMHLPSTSSKEHIQLVWEQLQQEFGELDPLLLELCPPSIPLLTVMTRGWVEGGRPQDVAAFVRTYVREELMEEVSAVL